MFSGALKAEIAQCRRHVSKVPLSEVAAPITWEPAWTFQLNTNLFLSLMRVVDLAFMRRITLNDR
jgi:hypothetical protein